MTTLNSNVIKDDKTKSIAKHFNIYVIMIYRILILLILLHHHITQSLQGKANFHIKI